MSEARLGISTLISSLGLNISEELVQIGLKATYSTLNRFYRSKVALGDKM